jgi:ribosomal subunit interface protein
MRVDIVVKGRHTEVPERFRRHAADKLTKVAKLDPKVLLIDVEVCHESNPRLSSVSDRVELTCRSRGPVIRAEAAAGDPYAALDLAAAKLEARLRRAADRRRIHRGARTPVSVAAATSAAATSAAADGAAPVGIPYPSSNGHGDLHPAVTEEDVAEAIGPLTIREKTHHAEPMTLEQAMFEMELVGHDFFLFVDAAGGLPSVVYRRHGYDYGVIRLSSGAAGG